mmetsp:Transcript_1431/g.3206  ORF Transcript_1431/g.3206 Transcript_1431/m.3206 type:complete len:128 (+) Transcript_1431:94-477(+)
MTTETTKTTTTTTNNNMPTIIDDPLLLADLQSRVSDLELSKTHNDVSAILQKERADMLLHLREIKEAMVKEASGDGGSGSGRGGGASSKELEQLRAENKELKKVNAKQQYRIEHLVSNLRGALEGDK